MRDGAFKQLLDKYLLGHCSADEQRLLEKYYLELEDTSTFELSDADADSVKGQMLRKIYEDIYPVEKRSTIKHLSRRWYAAAAVIIMLIAGGYFGLFNNRNKNNISVAKQEIIPGGNKAILTLSNGRQINLTDASSGSIADQSGSKIIKSKDGEIVYRNNAPTDGIAYNTVATPKGGQYSIILPDGTKVMLNAQSSLKYPTAFKGEIRLVELSGEAYFEVVHNSRQPFRVRVNGQLIQDIGTQFNVNAYNDEPEVKTTLLEGSIKVSSNKQSLLIAPGEQAVSDNTGTLRLKKLVDIEKVVAWKNGNFQFDNDDIYAIMRQLSRWYDVDIRYEGDFSGRKFSGMVSRYANFENALDIMQSSDEVHFKTVGKTVIVMP